MRKFLVTVWKTETYSTKVEVEADNELDAMTVAEEEASEDPDIIWGYCESTIEADILEELNDEAE